MARVPLPEVGEYVDRLPGLSPSIDLDSLNVVRAQGNNPPMLAAVIEYVGSLYDLLPADVRELAILAAGREKRSAYEWHQHVPVARDEGIDDATIRAIGSEDDDALSDRDRAVVAFVRAQCRGGVTDEHHGGLAEHFDDAGVVAISRLAANYAGTADFIAALDVPLEEEFVGWTPE